MFATASAPPPTIFGVARSAQFELGVATSPTMGGMPKQSPTKHRAEAASGDEHDPSFALMTVEDVARALRLSPLAVYRMAARSSIPGLVRIGRRLRFHREIISHWIRRKLRASTSRGTE